MSNTKAVYVEPINRYTGTVSLFAIMQNIKNGFTKFPTNMGSTQREKSVNDEIDELVKQLIDLNWKDKNSVKRAKVLCQKIKVLKSKKHN